MNCPSPQSRFPTSECPIRVSITVFYLVSCPSPQSRFPTCWVVQVLDHGFPPGELSKSSITVSHLWMSNKSFNHGFLPADLSKSSITVSHLGMSNKSFTGLPAHRMLNRKVSSASALSRSDTKLRRLWQEISTALWEETPTNTVLQQVKAGYMFYFISYLE